MIVSFQAEQDHGFENRTSIKIIGTQATAQDDFPKTRPKENCFETTVLGRSPRSNFAKAISDSKVAIPGPTSGFQFSDIGLEALPTIRMLQKKTTHLVLHPIEASVVSAKVTAASQVLRDSILDIRTYLWSSDAQCAHIPAVRMSLRL